MRTLILSVLIVTASAIVVSKPEEKAKEHKTDDFQKQQLGVFKDPQSFGKANKHAERQMEKTLVNTEETMLKNTEETLVKSFEASHAFEQANKEAAQNMEKVMANQPLNLEKVEVEAAPVPKAVELKATESKCEKFVEILENQGNGAAYIGKSFIGGQKMDVIWDTGSDEFVVNSIQALNPQSPCLDMVSMKQHDCYSRTASKDYSALEQYPKQISYGSGNTVVLPGVDKVNFIGNKCANKNVKFMEVMETDIPQLSSHEIDAVGGLGTKNFEKVTFLSQMGVDRFSMCFLGDNSQPGKLIWNDDKPEEYEEGFKFTTMPVHGTDYWAVEVTDFTLASPGEDNSVVGCKEKSCRAVVDSGTSLITLDPQTLKAVESQLNKFEQDSKLTCNDKNLNEFPVIKFYLAGQEHRLHPQDYLMYTETNEIPQYVREVLHFNSQMFPFLKEPESKKECVMMFTPPMGDNLVILGMPFFRNYLVQFDKESRTISTAPHDGECKPAQPSFLQVNTKNHIKLIDPTKLRVSAAYHQLKKQAAEKSATTGSFLH